MSSSNCCFLTCIQVSQEAGQVVWYSHLFQNFPQFIVIHTVKGFEIVNTAEIDVFLELFCFLHDPADVGNLISGSSAFSKTSLSIRKFMVHVLLKPGLENPRDGRAWWAAVYGVTQSRTRLKWLSNSNSNKAEIDVFLELSCFFHDPADVGVVVQKKKREMKWDKAIPDCMWRRNF